MGISDIYMTYEQRRNIGHFANLVRIAKADGIISESEIVFLNLIAKKYNISDDKFKDIFKNTDNYPTVADLENLERIERLYDMIKIIYKDANVSKPEVASLKKIVTGLAFPLKKVDKIVEFAMKIEIENCDLERFQKEILKALKD
jgi:uncharacterized tellurite resistance protein B-like protein